MDETKENKEEKPKKGQSYLVKKTCEVNVGTVYKLEKGDSLPKELVELGQGYLQSFKTEGII